MRSLHTHNNADGNKIFSSVAWYYGDTYVLSQMIWMIVEPVETAVDV